jgi:hypothetical protein
LTNPDTIPLNDTTDPFPLPSKASPSRLYKEAISQVLAIASNPVYANNTCAGCLAGLEVAKFLALAAPEQVSGLLVALCVQFKFTSDCVDTYGPLALGPTITQVLANANVAGLDGEVRFTFHYHRKFIHTLGTKVSLYKLHQQIVSHAAYFPSQFDRLVRKAETKPSSTSKTAQWTATKSLAYFRFPFGCP